MAKAHQTSRNPVGGLCRWVRALIHRLHVSNTRTATDEALSLHEIGNKKKLNLSSKDLRVFVILNGSLVSRHDNIKSFGKNHKKHRLPYLGTSFP